MEKEAKKSTIIGFIRPLLLTKDKCLEKNAKISIVTAEGQDYIISPKGAGNDLLEHINANVTAHGLLRKEEELSYFTVREYTLNDGFEHQWYDDESEKILASRVK